MIASEFSYNAKGQLTVTKTTSGDMVTTETISQYDDRGRVKAKNSSTGSSVSYIYLNREVETAANGRTFTKTFDAWGNLLSSIDPVSSVSYAYHSSGQPKTITSDGASFSMTYHDTGKQETLSDPNAGTTTYTYDAAGRMTTQTDARGNITAVKRDLMGRDSCIIMSDGVTSSSTTYAYGASGYEKGRLRKMQTENDSVCYTYNKYGQPYTEKRYMDGMVGSLDFIFEYNSKRQLQKTTYPGSIEVSNEYDAYGNLVKVKAGAQTVWELVGNTGTRNTTKLGGTMTATQTYNSQHGRLSNLKTVKFTL